MKRMFSIFFAVFFCFSSYVYSGTIDCKHSLGGNMLPLVHAVRYPDDAGIAKMPLDVGPNTPGITYVIVTNKIESVTVQWPVIQMKKEQMWDANGIEYNLYWVDVPDYSYGEYAYITDEEFYRCRDL